MPYVEPEFSDYDDEIDPVVVETPWHILHGGEAGDYDDYKEGDEGVRGQINDDEGIEGER